MTVRLIDHDESDHQFIAVTHKYGETDIWGYSIHYGQATMNPTAGFVPLAETKEESHDELIKYIERLRPDQDTTVRVSDYDWLFIQSQP